MQYRNTTYSESYCPERSRRNFQTRFLRIRSFPNSTLVAENSLEDTFPWEKKKWKVVTEALSEGNYALMDLRPGM